MAAGLGAMFLARAGSNTSRDPNPLLHARSLKKKTYRRGKVAPEGRFDPARATPADKVRVAVT